MLRAIDSNTRVSSYCQSEDYRIVGMDRVLGTFDFIIFTYNKVNIESAIHIKGMLFKGLVEHRCILYYKIDIYKYRIFRSFRKKKKDQKS